MKSKVFDMLIGLLVLIISCIGIFYSKVLITGSSTNIYGDVVEFFGRGIYARESIFKGPIFVGADLVMFAIAISFLLFLIVSKKQEVKKIVQIGYYTIFLYYTASLALGTMMNELFLAYIAGFSLSLFLLITSIFRLDLSLITNNIENKRISKLHLVFLIISGLSVSVWLFEILEVIVNGRPSEIIGMKSTEPTFVIDLAIVLPTCIISMVLLKKKQSLGAVLSFMTTSLISAVGLIVISQTLVQSYYGVEITLIETLLYVVVFVVLASFSMIFSKKSYNLIKT